MLLYGAGNKIRTRDLLITNQLLYQLSYAGVIFLLYKLDKSRCDPIQIYILDIYLSYCIYKSKWRKRRDSNPRRAINPRPLSRRVL